jgi:hypothetical protein
MKYLMIKVLDTGSCSFEVGCSRIQHFSEDREERKCLDGPVT